jgi:hypothetical protein
MAATIAQKSKGKAKERSKRHITSRTKERKELVSLVVGRYIQSQSF